MTAKTAPVYRIQPQGQPPPGYPAAAAAADYCTTPGPLSYAQRRQAYLAHVLRSPAPQNTKGAWHELARCAAGGEPHLGIFEASLDFIDARQDCADFVLHAVLRGLYQGSTVHRGSRQVPVNPDTPAVEFSLPAALLERMRHTLLNFKYFPDEPGIDSLCTWTENHYILYTSAAYLAGQLYPDEVFCNSGQTGREKQAINRPRLLRWLELRFRTGFSEWLSHVYYDEDFAALLALYDFAAEAEIRQKAAMVLDLLLLDMALNSFQGVFGATHGRSYERSKKWAAEEGTTDTARLLFGAGIFSGCDNLSAAAFALSSYRPPGVIERIADAPTPPAPLPAGGGSIEPDAQIAFRADMRSSPAHLPAGGGSLELDAQTAFRAATQAGPDGAALENRQRMGIRLAELERWGLRPDNFEDGMHCLTLEAYLHPRTITNTLRMFERCNWWENDFLSDFKPYRRLLQGLGALGGLPLLARALERDLCRNTREEVNIYTYKTADYMLSTAQDYRKGCGGDQQHIWQATLGPDAVCFTTHPAKLEGTTPNYWTGSGLLPRAAQVRNVAIIIYHLEKIPALYVPVRHFFTHAWLPVDRFDEVSEQAGWIFARKGNGYLALRSLQPYHWNHGAPDDHSRNPEDAGREVIAEGADTIWICQLGRLADDGSFARFMERLSAAAVARQGLQVEFDSPGNGRIRFGWEGNLSVDGQAVALRDYPRYANPFCQAAFGGTEIRVEYGAERIMLDWSNCVREPGDRK